MSTTVIKWLLSLRSSALGRNIKYPIYRFRIPCHPLGPKYSLILLDSLQTMDLSITSREVSYENVTPSTMWSVSHKRRVSFHVVVEWARTTVTESRRRIETHFAVDGWSVWPKNTLVMVRALWRLIGTWDGIGVLQPWKSWTFFSKMGFLSKKEILDRSTVTSFHKQGSPPTFHWCINYSHNPYWYQNGKFD